MGRRPELVARSESERGPQGRRVRAGGRVRVGGGLRAPRRGEGRGEGGGEDWRSRGRVRREGAQRDGYASVLR